MKRIIIMTAITALLGMATSCKEQSAPPAEGSRIGFAISFFKNANSVTPKGENVIVSPYSAGVALSMLEVGAGGETKAEIDNALNGTFFKSEKLDGEGQFVAKSANSVWISNKISVSNNYVGTLEKDFDAYIGNMDFSSPATVHEINNWCSENTNGKIPEIIDKLDPNIVMVLVNALYFNAPWVKAFNPELTHDDVFHGAGGEVTVPMMYKKDTYEYAEYQGFQIVEIPYGGEHYAMYIILPPAGMSIDSAVPYLDENIYKTAMGMLSAKKIMLTMPKFKLTASLFLNDVLKRMGMTDAFKGSANFSGISESGRLQLDAVKQKCFIDVNEMGTEAAAVTSAQIRLTSLEDTPVMNVDRPFFFMIADNSSENVLFAGKIVNLE